ncbi:MAG: DUF2207 domain-containing protein [Nigerium sp.]|nr:DUF2207 domain-containing protein [Nigerium sp.]
MIRVTRLLAVVFAVLITVVTAPTAHADDTPEAWRIPDLKADVVVDAEGVSTVTLDLTFDFADEPGHGPYVALSTQQAVDDNPDVWRMIDVEVTDVSSPTGAPAHTQITHEDGALLIRIGSEGTRVQGVQSYRIVFTARGLIAPRHATSGLDEFNWNVVGSGGWDVPIDHVGVSVVGPVGIDRTACFSGTRYDQPCQASSSGRSATFAAGGLAAGDGVQVVAGFPAGTFVGAEPRFTKRFHVGNVIPVNATTVGLTGALTALGVGVVLMKRRRWSRDEVYLGLTPGLRPAPGHDAAVGLARLSQADVAVAFTPPKGASVGEVGVLLDTRADNVDVTASILDLAARGHFQIIENGEKSWRFVRRATGDPRTPAEDHIVSTLFKKGNDVTTGELRDKKYHALLPGARERLENRVIKDLNWFKGSPRSAQVLALLTAVMLIFGGVFLGLVLGFAFGLGLVGLAPIVTGLLLAPLSLTAGRRTAEGSAVLAQAKGFELYLRTAEADQIRFEEGIDVFSRYLPWATIFGVAERWAGVFAQLEREGRYQRGDWYVGPGSLDTLRLSMAMNALTHELSSSMVASTVAQSASTAGTSGGSGFSGGGGFGGTGGGGW